jgi:CRISPR-associated endonuclease Csn1
MKKILGLDLGTASIGWAFIHEAESDDTVSQIIKTGVRIIHYGDNMSTKDASGKVSGSKEPLKDFEKGMGISMNAGRTQSRSMRRSLQRYKLRRAHLLNLLLKSGIIQKLDDLGENGNGTTFETYKLRASAAENEVSLVALARILIMINKKRGYKSNRKAKTQDEGKAIDSMEIAKEMHDEDLTPGQYVHQWIKQGKSGIPSFYRSDLENEFRKVWEFQKTFYPEILTASFLEKMKGKEKKESANLWSYNTGKERAENPKGREEIKQWKYALRSSSLNEQKSLEELGALFVDLNGEISNSSGYLGAISDRSKVLYFEKITVGQYLERQVKASPHARLKKQVFYRQDYMDEFERIWETQKQFHSVLTNELKKEIRDTVIFYQRRLKSAKHLVVNCEFEKHHKAIPKSSPLFQESRMLQSLNKLTIKQGGQTLTLDADLRAKLLDELVLVDQLKAETIKKRFGAKDWEIKNDEKIEGNRTLSKIFYAYVEILGNEGYDLSEIKSFKELKSEVITHFEHLGIQTEIVRFDEIGLDKDYAHHPAYEFWHLLYSTEDDDRLIEKLQSKYGFTKQAAQLLADITFEPDYGRLSSKALRKILPFLRNGLMYDKACTAAGYNHSSAATSSENAARKLVDKLELVERNTLRNPIVEKILNQLVHLVNAILEHPQMGRPDEIRIELSRELKNSADQRKSMTDGIKKATAENERVAKVLKDEFGMMRPNKNSILRYRLWEDAGKISIYSGQPIQASDIFGNKYDIDHIIPQAKLFDDSYGNKVLCEKEWNLDKGDRTAFDFLSQKLNEESFNAYEARVNRLEKEGKIKRGKAAKLLTPLDKVPQDFVERQLKETQYIVKKAKEILLSAVRDVNITIGQISERLRRDWELVDVLQELNWDKYQALNLIEVIEGENGKRTRRIKDWTKRNDHRHHAMDAITVAFTKRAYVQYLNGLSARGDGEKGYELRGIEQKYLGRDEKNKLRFKAPMHNFREEAKKHLAGLLISFSNRNKVSTWNKHKIKTKNGVVHQNVLTPRGQLHNETIYGSIKRYETNYVAVGAKMNVEMASTIASKNEREAILKRLSEFENDPKKAFAGKNSLAKNPIYLSDGTTKISEKVKVVKIENQYTIRKEVGPDLVIEKVIDAGVKRKLQERLALYGNDAKKAFTNLQENPIWLNEKAGIAIHRVKITGISNAQSLHTKSDHKGNKILDPQRNEIPTSFVSTSNNHHGAIYQAKETGAWYEEMVSFFEATQRMNNGEKPIRPFSAKGDPLVLTLQRNDYFLFPGEDFNPKTIDLHDPMKREAISKHLFRVQKMASGDYTFRHHLETSVDTNKELFGLAYKRLTSMSSLQAIKKLRVNRLGEIELHQ